MKQFHVEPNQQLGPGTIHQGECLQWLKSLSDKCCDIFTDPPYNVGKNYGDTWNDKMPDDDYAKWITEILTECNRVANNLTIYVPKKYNLLFLNTLGKDFQEIILTFRPRGAIRNGYSDQFNKLLTNAKQKTEKPILNVWENMMQRAHGYFFREETYGHPGYTSEVITRRVVVELCNHQVICDPFMGTGTTAVAALRYGRDFIGCEINPKYIEIATRRIRNMKAQPTLL